MRKPSDMMHARPMYPFKKNGSLSIQKLPMKIPAIINIFRHQHPSLYMATVSFRSPITISVSKWKIRSAKLTLI